MWRLDRPLAILALLAAVAAHGRAWADIPPPNACSELGSSCDTAGPNFDQPGKCTASKCTRVGPDADGGVSTYEYDCNLCTASSDGSTDAKEKDSGCAMGRVRAEGALAGAMLLAGVAALLAERRRRG